MDEYNPQNTPEQSYQEPLQPQGSGDQQPGHGAAVASLVLGIIAVVLWFFGYSALVSVILGIVGLILSGNAKKEGFTGGMQTAGFVLSLIGLIGGAIFFVACIACAGAIGSAGASSVISRPVMSVSVTASEVSSASGSSSGAGSSAGAVSSVSGAVSA